MNLNEAHAIIKTESTSGKKYYHGSMDKLPVGTILKPQPNYENDWKDTDFYSILEKNRPSGMLAHKDSVFMCDNNDDLDNAGGGTEWVFVVEPLGKVERHDMNWGSEISFLISDGLKEDDPKIVNAAKNYWSGKPHPDESIWEYLTSSAKILSVKRY